MGFFKNFPYTNFHEINLDWILQEVKKAVETANSANATAKSVESYVAEYFNNLNLDKETEAVLRRMVADGTLTKLIAAYLDPEIENQNQAISSFKAEIMASYNNLHAAYNNLNTSYNTLSARMDSFTALPDGSTSGDAELADARIGFRGGAFANVGDNIRDNDTFNHNCSVNIGNSIAPKRFVPKYQLISDEAVTTGGNTVSADGYDITTPILVLPGQSIEYLAVIDNVYALGFVFDVNGRGLELLTYGAVGDTVSKGFIYTNNTVEDVYVVCTSKHGSISHLEIVNTHIYTDIADIVFDNKFIRNDGSITPTAYFGSFDVNSSYCVSSVFELKCGESIMLSAKVSQSIPAIIKTDKVGASFEAVEVGKGTATSYYYTAKDSVEYLKVQALKENASSLVIVSKSNTCNTNTANDTRRGVVTFIVDDGRAGDNELYSEFAKRGLKCGFALLTPMALDNRCKEYLEWCRSGFNVLAHSTDGNTMGASVSESEINEKLKESLRILSERGFEIRGWVTPSSEMADKFRPLVNNYYTYGYTVYKGNYVPDDNDRPYNVFSDNMNELWRINLDSPIATLKYCVDKTIENRGFLTFYVHAGDLDENRMAQFRELLDYIEGHTIYNRVKCLAPNEAVQYYFTPRKTDI